MLDLKELAVHHILLKGKEAMLLFTTLSFTTLVIMLLNFKDQHLPGNCSSHVSPL